LSKNKSKLLPVRDNWVITEAINYDSMLAKEIA